MRLYAKLLMMVVCFASLQRFTPSQPWCADTWFGLRCHLAQVAGDERLQEELVNEHYRQHRTLEDQAIDNISAEIYLARDAAEEATAAEEPVAAGDNTIWPG